MSSWKRAFENALWNSRLVVLFAVITSVLAGPDLFFVAGLQSLRVLLSLAHCADLRWLSIKEKGSNVNNCMTTTSPMLCRKYFILITSIVATLDLPRVAPASCAAGHTKGRAATPFTPALKPGDYVWRPEVSPAGPVIIQVSLIHVQGTNAHCRI